MATLTSPRKAAFSNHTIILTLRLSEFSSASPKDYKQILLKEFDAKDRQELRVGTYINYMKLECVVSRIEDIDPARPPAYVDLAQAESEEEPVSGKANAKTGGYQALSQGKNLQVGGSASSSSCERVQNLQNLRERIVLSKEIIQDNTFQVDLPVDSNSNRFFRAPPVRPVKMDQQFSVKGVRFKVVAVDPPGIAAAVVGTDTTVFYEGPLLERQVLSMIHVLPYEYSFTDMSDKYITAPASKSKFARPHVNEEHLLKDYLNEYFAQRSSDFSVGENFFVVEESARDARLKRELTHDVCADEYEGRGIWFKVINCEGGANGVGGVGPKTKIVCKGMPVRGALPAAPAAAGSSPSAGTAASSSSSSRWNTGSAATRSTRNDQSPARPKKCGRDESGNCAIC